MTDTNLASLMDRWLTRPAPRLSLRFPAALEARFEADTGAARCRTLMLMAAIGYGIGILFFPVILDIMPDMQAQAWGLYIGLAMPLGLLTAAAMRFNPPLFLRESLPMLANMVCIGVDMYLFAKSHAPFAELWVAAIGVLLAYNTVGLPQRPPVAAAMVAWILGSYALALSYHTELSHAVIHGLLAATLGTAAYLLAANWRHAREERRNYLLVLRATLQRQDLSLRNTELDALARRDPLTGLANRRAYDAWRDALWAEALAKGGRLGMIMVDIDRFKLYNDFYGHAAGDSCLQKIARCLREQLRDTTDLVARLGGEEFAILLPGLSDQSCADVAERLRHEVARLELPHCGIGQHGLVTVSAGVASATITAKASPEALFSAADSALYQAKQSGRNRICIATLHPAPHPIPAT